MASHSDRPDQERGGRRLGVINGLRGIAILGVVFHHYLGHLTAPGKGSIHLGPIPISPLTFLTNGPAGVNLLFILSGFVLDLPYARGERTLRTSEERRTFLVRRLKRLLPLFYFSTLVLEVLSRRPAIGTFKFWKEQALLATGLFPFSPEDFMPSPNFVLWSLGLEIWFSVAFLGIILAAERWGMRRLLGASLVLGLVVRLTGSVVAPELAVTGTPHWLRDGLPARLDDFLVGMFASRIFVAWMGKKSRGELRWMFLGGVLAVFLACELCDLIAMRSIPSGFRAITNNLFQLGFVGMLLPMALAQGRGPAVRLFSFKPLQLVGMMCFSFYVWHVRVWEIVGPGAEPRAVRLASALLFLTLLSAFSYRYVEFGEERNLRKLFIPGD